jgi:hypothetical protein
MQAVKHLPLVEKAPRLAGARFAIRSSNIIITRGNNAAATSSL